MQPFALDPCGGGYWQGHCPEARPGDRYTYRLDGTRSRPDPASRYQPEGVHGPSEIIDPGSYPWRDENWRGVPREDLIIYEIHVGTFTAEGTFAAARDRLDEVVDLGATAVEIMPVAQTPGRWNWGYDGVDLFAPAHAYGTPDDFKALVDACHARGLAVILDVVYNHLGPEGNYLAEFGPYVSRKHRTPWGDALNYDGRDSRPVRDFVVANVRYWLAEFHLDGLRLDAIRLMRDDSGVHIVHEIAEAVAAMRPSVGRPLHLIAEANVYDPLLLAQGYDALWSDEVPHGILSLLVDQDTVAQREYRGAGDLAHLLRTGYLHRYEDGRVIVRDEGPDAGEIGRIVHGLQTHDQVGNHPDGARLNMLVGAKAQRAAAALILLYPSVPLIFMGEEFASPSPFCFFTDFGDPRLRRGVEEGRKRDYDHHDWSRYVSPLSNEAFHRSRLPSRSEGDEATLRWYRTLLEVRREWTAAGWLRPEHLEVEVEPETDLFVLRYGDVWVAARLGRDDAGTGGSDGSVSLPRGTVFLHSEGASGDAAPGLRLNEAAVGRI